MKHWISELSYLAAVLVAMFLIPFAWMYAKVRRSVVRNQNKGVDN